MGWKLKKSFRCFSGTSPLNRTIVGWKLVGLLARSAGLIAFKSHHSGMETLLVRNLLLSRFCFKSHHSGMETRDRGGGTPQNSGSFKSHHSGMETIQSQLTWIAVLTLNRTIVGWNHPEGAWHPQPASPLNRTIVGWKREGLTVMVVPLQSLNRTIVGWKPLRESRTSLHQHSLNRTIVGWKLGFVDYQRRVHKTLNRTIVGWKQG